jgi:hypothetical protein
LGEICQTDRLGCAKRIGNDALTRAQGGSGSTGVIASFRAGGSHTPDVDALVVKAAMPGRYRSVDAIFALSGDEIRSAVAAHVAPHHLPGR